MHTREDFADEQCKVRDHETNYNDIGRYPKWRNGNIPRCARNSTVTSTSMKNFRGVLQDYGMQGWELVQVLEPKADGRCHMLFKRQKALFPYLEPATH